MIETEYPDLAPLLGGTSFNRIVSTLFYATLLRYSEPWMLKSLVNTNSIATRSKLKHLQNTGYLASPTNGIYISTVKTINFLVKQGFNRKLLPEPARGKGAEQYHYLQLYPLLTEPFYKQLLFPHFEYLIPDALLVLQDGNRYQLQFIEIEEQKPNWQEYLETKRRNYERLARDMQVYRYWKAYSQHVGLPCPEPQDFKFCVRLIGNMKVDWPGWINCPGIKRERGED